jgi:hypothetical protein
VGYFGGSYFGQYWNFGTLPEPIPIVLRAIAVGGPRYLIDVESGPAYIVTVDAE